MTDLVNKMASYGSVYSKKYLKMRLQEHYGDSLIITTESGKDDIVTMREKQTKIIREVFESNDYKSDDDRKKAILEAAVRLLRSDIKKLVPKIGDVYPAIDELNLPSMLAYIPESLTLFCRSLFVGTKTDCKVAAIGQAIIQAVRPVATLPHTTSLDTKTWSKFCTRWDLRFHTQK